MMALVTFWDLSLSEPWLTLVLMLSCVVLGAALCEWRHLR